MAQVKKKKLTPKERQFVSAYLKDISRNATQAAITAGYSEKTARQIAASLLSKVYIQEAIEVVIGRIEEKSLVDATYVIKNLREVAERCMEHVPAMEFDRVEKKLIQKTQAVIDEENNSREVGVFEFDSTGANRSLELLGKTMGMFVDKHDVTVGGRMVIVRPKR